MSVGPRPSIGHSVILCEGFDDRSFWAGWLTHLGCVDPTDGGRNRDVRDVNDEKVVGKGRFLFATPTGSSLVIQPINGRSNLSRSLRDELKEHRTKPRRRILLNLDSDADSFETSADRGLESIIGIARDHGVTVEDPRADYFEIDTVAVAAVIWECLDGVTPGVPAQQTLERLVCASIQAAYPGRGSGVDDWLGAEPPPTTAVGPKHVGYSYLAKWYADFGADDFYRAVWRDPATAEQLKLRLQQTGAWGIVERLVQG